MSASAKPILLLAAKVWTPGDDEARARLAVLIDGGRIAAAGPTENFAGLCEAERVDLFGATLLPGLIDAHSHLFLHPYNETSWDDQVLKEPVPYRTLRAARQARATLMAGVTT